MKHIFNTDDFQLKNTAVCLGKFDGIHKGHRLLINRVLSYKKENLETVVFTFALHPSSLFSKKEAKLIDSMPEKIEKLEELGIDTLISYPFTRDTASMQPEEFVKKVLVEKIGAKVVVVGKDFHFGYQRKGNVSLLKKLQKECGYQLVAIDKLAEDQRVVSSTRIRSEIKNGNMEKVTSLLGKPYTIKGEVLHGKQLGRTIGMPTINQAVEEAKLVPPNGVYVSNVYLEDGVYGGITNIGTKPTVSGEKILGVETNIFDFSGDLYGKIVKTELLHFVRGEQKFATIDDLTKQMHTDKEVGKDYLASNNKINKI